MTKVLFLNLGFLTVLKIILKKFFFHRNQPSMAFHPPQKFW